MVLGSPYNTTKSSAFYRTRIPTCPKQSGLTSRGQQVRIARWSAATLTHRIVRLSIQTTRLRYARKPGEALLIWTHYLPSYDDSGSARARLGPYPTLSCIRLRDAMPVLRTMPSCICPILFCWHPATEQVASLLRRAFGGCDTNVALCSHHSSS